MRAAAGAPQAGVGGARGAPFPAPVIGGGSVGLSPHGCPGPRCAGCGPPPAVCVPWRFSAGAAVAEEKGEKGLWVKNRQKEALLNEEERRAWEALVGVAVRVGCPIQRRVPFPARSSIKFL